MTITCRGAIVVLVILALALITARVRTYHEPPEWDIGTYLAIGRELLEGKRLYADAWDVKPPAIFVSFATVQFVSGDGALPVYLLSVITAIATLVGIYFTAQTPRGRSAGVLAAIFWVAMCYAPWTGGTLPNTEVFINAAVAGAVALWLRGPLAELSWERCIAIALLFALASLYKQVAILIFVCISIADLLSDPRARRPSHVKKLTAMLAIIVMVWCAVFAYFTLTGRGWLAWQTLVVTPRAYSGGFLHNMAVSVLPQRIFPSLLAFALPALALTIIGLLAAAQRPRLMLIGLIIGTHLAVAAPGQFFPHYYQLWFVPLSIGAGWGAAALIGRLHRKSIGCVVIALALLAMIAPQADWYALSGRESARRKYGDFYIYAHDAFIAASERLAPNETFYTWSDEAYAYAITHRRPPATAIWKMHTTTGPLADFLTQRTLADLQKNPPAMIILYGDQPVSAGHPILAWTRSNYEPVAHEQRKFFPLSLYVRKGRGD